MSCNTCAKGFSLLRQEKGCPGCGFSFCSKCLNSKVFLPKLNSEAKVCTKCKKALEQKDNKNQAITPPDAYYKRLAGAEEKSISVNMSNPSTTNTEDLSIDDQIQARLKKLKEKNVAKTTSEEEIAKRLQGIKGVSSTSDAEISERLAKLRGMPVIVNQPSLPVQDLRTEQEQADDLMKQYLEQTQIDSKYKDELDSLISDMEARMQKLKGAPPEKGAGVSITKEPGVPSQIETEDEEESVRKIVEKIKAEASIEENEIAPPTQDELPFCEICNEDATMRCLGCKYLFCKRCFRDHQDDDDGCNRYEPYQAPKGSGY